MHPTVDSLRHTLVVSCQAAPNDPMEDTETLRRVARSAVMGGAEGLRLNSPADIRAVRLDTGLPIIGIQKSYVGGQLRITPDFASARALAAAGASVIALDCTDRVHVAGEPWREVLRRVKQELGLPVMADIATLSEGMQAAEEGADLIGTTLHGYTEETAGSHGFNWELLGALVRESGRGVVAEGHLSTPEEAVRALEAGAWCVVAGSAITRPGTIAARFRRAVDRSRSKAAGGRMAVALDLGGSSIKSALVSERGVVSHLGQTPTDAAGGRETIARAMHVAVAERLRDAAGTGIVPVGVGIASAGAIDAARGTVFAATENLPGWAGFDIRGSLRKVTGLPVFVENDAHAAALAEMHFGAGSGLRSFVAVTLGTGVGGGLVLDGRLVRGQHGFAGTVGHQTIRMDGRTCNCGRRGCLEAYVSAGGLVAEYLELGGRVEAEDVPAKALLISRGEASGEDTAVAAYGALAGYLAEGLANLYNVLDPEAILLSGGLIEGKPGFGLKVQERVEARLHFGRQRAPRVMMASAGRAAGVQGAAAAVFDGLT